MSRRKRIGANGFVALAVLAASSGMLRTVVLTLLGATAICALAISCSGKARGQGSQWDLLLAAKPDATRLRKDRSRQPRFYIKRKKSSHKETRRARSDVPARGGVRAASSSLPESRMPLGDSFNVRALMIATPYHGAFAMRALPPVDDPMPVPMPPPIVPIIVPWTETPEFKAMAAGAFCAALCASVFYVSKGGKNAGASRA